MLEHFPVVVSHLSAVQDFPSLQVLTVRLQETELSIGFLTQTAVSQAFFGLQFLQMSAVTQV